MLKFIGRNMLVGLVTILPVVLTIYLLYGLAVSTETVLGGMIQWVLPESIYRPGMGALAGLSVILVVGLLMNAYVVQRLFAFGEDVLYRMPVIKTVYRAIRDFFQYFSPTSKKEFKQVVAVTLGNTDMQVIGFITQAVPERLPEGLREEGHVLVYLPMSYMVGGYAVLLPKDAVRPLNMSMEEAMRFTLTAGVTGKSEASA